MARFFRSMSADLDKINPGVLEWLMMLDNNYCILVEFTVTNKNCDFAILGPDLIAVLEVKDYTFQLRGNANSHWLRLPRRIPLAISKVGNYPANPIGQATKIGDSFSGFLQRNLDNIFGLKSKVAKESIKAFPFVVIPRPHPANRIINEADFCWVVQGKESFFKEIFSKRLPAGLQLTADQHERIAQLLGLEREQLPGKLLPSSTISDTPIYGDQPLQIEHLQAGNFPEASLVVKEPDRSIQEYSLAEKVTLIGRHPECHITIDFERASRKHCEIEYLNGAFFLKDLNSKHGTFLNGQQVNPGSYCLLSEGDLINLTSEGLSLTFHTSAG
jgi:hypothetical protein